MKKQSACRVNNADGVARPRGGLVTQLAPSAVQKEKPK